ncbi:M23 family metallopeptidase [Corynebacterium sp. TAE3-ERU12]|uniref:M23 family metallopeptidase n=1 Tax=Corynebacterium sp. TAE3-ERU12 TaxID=2849491 RepID=UPI001C47A6EB|nr:M23 family metallopeptidase [Corynebacterium sp. TAE3-ERU12]MBV7295224.1 M23 family metallopeptidase [Corynebacterium sp. TAE3-ERU12]
MRLTTRRRRCITWCVALALTVAVSTPLQVSHCFWAAAEVSVASAAPDGTVHLRPVPGAVIRAFDPPEKDWLPGHRGVDLAAPVGAAVRASGDAVVLYAGDVAHVPTISLQHPMGLRTTYQAVAPVVSRGDEVRAGMVIGHVIAGRDPGLQWGAKIGERYINPLDLLGLRPIVLKPTGGG